MSRPTSGTQFVHIQFPLAARYRISVVGRYRVLAIGGLPEVHWGASQRAVLDFMFVATVFTATACHWPHANGHGAAGLRWR